MIKMKLDLSKIEYSKSDLKRGIVIPKRLTKELAEFVGIVVGDGHVACRRSNPAHKNFMHYEIFIHGNIKDYDYYNDYVNNLAFALFNFKFTIKKLDYENTVFLNRDSKAVFSLLSKIMEIPHRKDDIRIPEIIRESKLSIKSAFLRGLADADFTLTIRPKEGKLYPTIKGVAKSKGLIDDICQILDELEIKYCKYLDEGFYEKRKRYYSRYCINVNGIKSIKRWFRKIGFSNKRHVERWKNYLKNAVERI
jgi:hypothetical protein